MNGPPSQQNQHNNPQQQWRVPKRVSRERRIEARDATTQRLLELRLQQLQFQPQQHQPNN